jgi:hypothetical protein
MSKFKEFFNMREKIWKNLPNIAEGFYNAFLDDLDVLPEEKKKEAEHRIETCTGCKYMSYNAKAQGLSTTEREDPHCTICGCLMKKKAFSFSEECPLNQVVVKDNIPYQLGGNPVWGFYQNTDKMVEELMKDSPVSTILKINDVDYLYLNIPSKFKKIDEH